MDHVPFVRDEEVKTVMKEIQESENKAVSITFDGTTSICETYAIIARFIHNDKIKQKLICLEFLKSATDADDIAALLMSKFQEFGIKASSVVAFSRDRASVNTKAIGNLKRVGFKHVLDLECFAHTINNAGERFESPKVKNFAIAFNNFITRSAKGRAFFKDICNTSPKRPSSVRWFANWEQCCQWFDVRSKMDEFFQKCLQEGAGQKSTIIGLKQMFNDDELLVELAALKDAGSGLCNALHMLEGDTFLAIHAYNIIKTILSHCNHIQLTNVNKILATEIFQPGHKEEYKASLLDHALDCITPALEYLKNKFQTEETGLKQNMNVFEACLVFHPLFADITVRRKGAGQLSTVLKQIGVFSETEMDNMASEYATYIALASMLDNEGASRLEQPGNNDCFDWWVRAKSKLPHFCSGAFKIALLQPSSACVERVFSLLANVFSNSQTSLLQDAREACIMLRYNSGQRMNELESKAVQSASVFSG
jgi:hypothetical protein